VSGAEDLKLILVDAPWSLAFFVRANWAWAIYTFDKSVFACSKAVAASGLYWSLMANSDIALSTNSGFSWFIFLSVAATFSVDVTAFPMIDL